MILAYIISNSAEEAETIALHLLEKRLVDSVNLLFDIKSYRRVDDKIIELKRSIILGKTKADLYKKIEDEVKRVQVTGTAIVFSMPITQISQDLFDSIQKNTL